MKNIINTSLIEQKYINKLVLEHDDKIDLILDKLNTNEKINHIFYEGQIYDSYSLLIDILSEAKKEVIIIDNKELYHSGASFKDLGKKCFAISMIDDDSLLQELLDRIKGV